ncbi:serine carboxypeptidase S28 [Lasiosphaeris hirsuta]|uniref:Serine carboxypeptidase S28 n=1 Tax=Lasiosphaeris hirsuta TaxID=260670 RepID=A0AA40AS86_9PEZI|nr:serine carboxypeptidase S28 [Lasiosphaeris hirsuta]
MKSPGPFSFLVLFLCLLRGQAEAQFRQPLLPPPVAAAISADTLGGNSTFQQLIDHKNPSLGTFSQRYWWNTTYWTGPGSPVVLFTPGEVAANGYTGFLTNRTLAGLFAQEIGGATIVIEHRYWGESSPYSVLDTKNLTYLTLENSVADLVHFARTVQLPFDKSGMSNAPDAPWIDLGASYSAALAAWIHKLSPGTFWAYHASSGPVQAIYDYWAYFLPIEHGMPKNCSADISRITGYIDELIDNGNHAEIQALKEDFGLAGLAHADDFAGYMLFSGAVSGVVSAWQNVGPSSGYSNFFQMCDSIEGVRPVAINGTNSTAVGPWSNVTIPSADGIGLKKALPNLISYFRNEYLPNYCAYYKYEEFLDPMSVGCFESYDTSNPFFSDKAVNNTGNRQWFWMLCNEPFAYWQTGAPNGQHSVISRYVSTGYWQRQCGIMFPPQGNATYGSAAGRTVNELNALTEGWNLTNTTRLVWVNGEFDPWRSASVSSEIRPGGPLQSTPEVPVLLAKGGIHCSDISTMNGEVNKDIRNTQLTAVAHIKKWTDEFYVDKRGPHRRRVSWAA